MASQDDMAYVTELLRMSAVTELARMSTVMDSVRTAIVTDSVRMATVTMPRAPVRGVGRVPIFLDVGRQQ